MISQTLFMRRIGIGLLFRDGLLRFVPVILLVFVACSSVSDPRESLIRDIEDHLIAPCCWTQPISEHESDVAGQMREEVRAMVVSGMSRDEIMDHFVSQYGERILATPRPEGFNLLVYILPWAALILGAWILFIFLRKLRAPVPDIVPDTTSEPLRHNRYAAVIEKELQDMEEQ